MAKNPTNTAPPPKKRTVYSAAAGLKFSKTKPAGGDDEPTITLTGYALVWNVLSSDRGNYKVRLMPGSATFATPCLALYEHRFDALLGNTANGTLRIAPDDYGVKVQIDLPDTQIGRDVAELVEDGYLNGMSFSMANGFEEANSVTEGDQEIVEATKFTVDEVTVCVNPAFVDADVELQDPDAEDAAESDDDAAPVKRLNQSARLQRDRIHLYDL